MELILEKSKAARRQREDEDDDEDTQDAPTVDMLMASQNGAIFLGTLSIFSIEIHDVLVHEDAV